ncbi:hypothetical protein OE88DRAFT_1736198 [Heliocybe sulcata]|uniref:Uncharacterized protein n=1 Tax=Heliocybe sulcata TaxID=5364 RepID=A0A5C3MZF3_9AGAM|nr:hypothetical protein OE88DRAFT_1736198 [Heliocybe sulcata]
MSERIQKAMLARPYDLREADDILTTLRSEVIYLRRNNEELEAKNARLKRKAEDCLRCYLNAGFHAQAATAQYNAQERGRPTFPTQRDFDHRSRSPLPRNHAFGTLFGDAEYTGQYRNRVYVNPDLNAPGRGYARGAGWYRGRRSGHPPARAGTPSCNAAGMDAGPAPKVPDEKADHELAQEWGIQPPEGMRRVKGPWGDPDMPDTPTHTKGWAAEEAESEATPEADGGTVSLKWVGPPPVPTPTPSPPPTDSVSAMADTTVLVHLVDKYPNVAPRGVATTSVQHTTRRVELWKVLAAMPADASKREAFVDTALDVIRKGKYQAASENPNISFASAPTTHPYPYSPADDDAVIR